MERSLPRRYVITGLVALAVVAIAGWVLRWWVVVAWYDEAVHLFTGVAFVTPLLAALVGHGRARSLIPWKAVALGTLAWSGVGTGWELAEWSLDAVLGTNTLKEYTDTLSDLALIKEYTDTLSDLALNGAGALIGMLVGVWPISSSSVS